ncbi:MAG TPA: hypothetical protein DGT23_16305, partial [Micromonosporaceae bacterium]|nr:hypothetical protein [Micromonosporaceae bacterium]
MLAIVVVLLYFIYDDNPPGWDALTRTLLTVPMRAAPLIFLTGQRFARPEGRPRRVGPAPRRITFNQREGA